MRESAQRISGLKTVFTIKLLITAESKITIVSNRCWQFCELPTEGRLVIKRPQWIHPNSRQRILIHCKLPERTYKYLLENKNLQCLSGQRLFKLFVRICYFCQGYFTICCHICNMCN